MILPGRLRLTTLGDVLGAVFREGATGVLELVEESGVTAGRLHRVHVAGGLVTDVESAFPAPQLGVILRRMGAVDDGALGRLAERRRQHPGERVGEGLVAMGALSPSAIGTALRVQRRERLERLFLLGDARLAFRVACVGDRAAMPLGPGEFLIGRPRGRDRAAATAEAPRRRRDPVRSRALSTLGLGDGADRAAVQSAFRRLALHLHPDRHPTASVSERAEILRRFAELTAAYHALAA